LRSAARGEGGDDVLLIQPSGKPIWMEPCAWASNRSDPRPDNVDRYRPVGEVSSFRGAVQVRLS
jgi:hypothetical protein